MKLIYMASTLDLMSEKKIKSLVESGVAKQLESGVLYLLLETNE